MNLWQQKFSKPVISDWTPAEFNLAWNWIFQDGIESSILRLGIIRDKSLKLRKIGVKQSAEMAACQIWKTETQS